MTCREWLNVLAILESIDVVPGMPIGHGSGRVEYARDELNAIFRENPLRFLRRADDATRDAIWAEVERRRAGRPEQRALPGISLEEAAS